MNKDEFKAALAVLSWSQSECARKTGLTVSTVSRYATGETEIPEWLVRYLAAMSELAGLHERYVVPEARRRGRPRKSEDSNEG